MDTNVRTLQRTLNREGLDYRGLVNVIRVQRARELLGGTQMSITDISSQLGYSAPANFARAFRRITGVAPSDFRMFCRRSL
ncbi:helix-turn-helix transcriptional regulator [Amaricoccus solimangrovi]|uniref:helix-turn-helix transcriptional regulator n=1 Tax=Amaricoccus solimangrovi TaxID=2589815 RepID=UPI0015E2FDDD|nr:helix-turn-helix transcriptional regulator [Amaricoccus solimangrovi]